MRPRNLSSNAPIHALFKGFTTKRAPAHAAKRPTKMTLGVVAAGAATMIGVAAGVATGATAQAATVGNLGAGSHSITLSAPRQASAPLFDGGGAPAGHASAFRPAAAHPAATQTVAVKAAAKPSAAAPAHSATASASAKTAARVSTTGSAHAPAAQAKPAAPQHQAPKAPAKPFTIYDSVTPTAIPPHHEVATYATGGYAVPASQVAGRRHVFWIDTTGSDYAANVLDVEPGDATPSMAASWAYHRLAQDPKRIAVIYTMQSEWPACQQAVASLSAKMRYHIRWWIADPTGVPHILPGASATQWYWGQNYDITAAAPNF